MNSRFSIYDDDDMVSLLRSLFDGMTRPRARQLAHWISRAKDACIGPESGELWEVSADPELQRVYQAYQARLEEIGNADFGDLIMRTVQLLRNEPEVRRRTQQRFRVVLVDEYQDANVAQYMLLRELYGEGTYLCVVGDEDQSIYGFRGADVRNILTFSESFPGTEIIRLEENYRSTGRILSIASEVVAHNQDRLGKTLWTRNDEGANAVVALLEDQDEEAAYCAEIVGQGAPGETAILYRTNAQSRVFEQYFTRQGIPFRLVGTVQFYEREEVKDVLAFLAVLLNPRDEVAFRRIVNKPARGVGKSSIATIVEQTVAESGDLIQGARKARAALSSRASRGLGEFLECLDAALEALERAPLSAVVQQITVDTGLVDHYRRQDEVSFTQKAENLEELVNAAGKYGTGVEALSAFLEDVELDRARETGATAADALATLITMHNTKGLEFPRVIITGMEEGMFPRGDYYSSEVEEERRLFYVAITRAQRELHFTCCRRRRVRGRMTDLQPSPFLRDIPRELLSMVGEEEQPEDELPVGAGVYHDEYGSGVVAKKWYNGSELLVLVRFESGRTAQFLPRYTSLERISYE
jgi:DNA helicase-2/ATP-dependent DNA helicase PcrA